jgi:hypothetical protein
MPLWIKITIWALTTVSLGLSAWYTTRQSRLMHAAGDEDLLIENGRVAKVLAITLSLIVLIGSGVMVHVAFAYTNASYARLIAMAAWFVMLIAMLTTMLHFVRTQLLVTPEGIYVRRAIGERFITYGEILAIHHIEGEPWFELQVKQSRLSIRVSKEMRGWRDAIERITNYSEQAGSIARTTVDRDKIRILRFVTGLFR